jgi:hypothetical protein
MEMAAEHKHTGNREAVATPDKLANREYVSAAETLDPALTHPRGIGLHEEEPIAMEKAMLRFLEAEPD